MCRVAYAEFDAEAGSVPTIRHLVSDILDRWGVHNPKEDALLLTNELVTNAVTHAASGGVVSIAVANGMLEVGVSDSDRPSVAEVVPVNNQAFVAGGRGLFLVDRLAEEWGVVVLPQGKQVWMGLPMGDWSFRSHCVCSDLDPVQIRLGSGRLVRHLSGPWDL